MLTDFGFIVVAICALVGVPFYVFTLVAVIRAKACSGTFFRLFIVSGVVVRCTTVIQETVFVTEHSHGTRPFSYILPTTVYL